MQRLILPFVFIAALILPASRAIASQLTLLAEVRTSYESNAFRRSNPDIIAPGLSPDDFTVLPSLDLKYDHVLGNQQLYTEAKIGHKFRLLNPDFSTTEANGDAGLRYTLGSLCHGDIGGLYSRNEGVFEETQIITKNAKSHYAARLNSNTCSFGPFLGLGLSGGYDTFKNSSSFTKRANLNSYDGEIRAIYSSPVLGDLSLGAGYTHNTYPNRFSTQKSNVADGNSFVSGFVAFHRARTERLTIDLRAGITKVNPPPGVAQFTGFTGNIDIDWKPSTRLSIHPNLYKSVTPATDSIANSIREKGAGLQLVYLPSSRLTVTSSNKITGRLQDRQLFGQVSTGTPTRNFSFRPETTTTYSTELTAAYQIGQSITIRLGGEYTKRTSAISDRNYSNKRAILEISFQH